MSLKIFMDLFQGRRDCYGQQKFVMKEALTEEVFRGHVEGKQRIGVFPLHNGKSDGPGEWSSWIAADIDDKDFQKALSLKRRLETIGITAYIERSKSKGYHIFSFYDKQIEAWKLRAVYQMVLDQLGFICELFPKQDKADESGYGNFINLPLFGGDIADHKTIFVDDREEPLYTMLADMEFIRVNKIKIIEEIVAVNQMQRREDAPNPSRPAEGIVGASKISTPPCIKKILDGKIKQGEHNESWFRLAVYYKEKNIPKAETLVLLEDWNKKNPNKNKLTELHRTVQSVFERKYKSFPCGEGVLGYLCDKEACPLIMFHERNKDIQNGILTMVRRGEDFMTFRQRDLEFSLNNFQFFKGGKFKASLTMSIPQEKKLIFKDTVDLDIASHRKRFIKAAEKIESIADLELTLINLQDLVVRKVQEEERDKILHPKQLYIMTEQEKEDALKFLQSSPDLLSKVIEVTGRMGVIGEETLRLMAYLSFTSRITKDPISITVKGESSSGKSYGCQNIMKLIPEEGVHFMTRATSQAFFHMPEDGLQHRIVYINELPGSESADYSIRTAQSEGDLILFMPIKDPNTGDMQTVQKRVKGPVGFLITTTQPKGHDENETRNFSVYSDDSPELTNEIGKITIRRGLGEEFIIDDKEIHLWKNIQRLLNSDYQIIIPYAREVFASFPDKPVRIRRDRERFRNLINIVTLLHQYHREKKQLPSGKTVLYSNLADYYIAKSIAEALLTYTIYELSPSSEEIWKAIKEMEQAWLEAPENHNKEDNEFTFKYKEVAEHLEWKIEKLKKWTTSLLRANLIEYIDKNVGGKGKTASFKITRQGKAFSSSSLSFLPDIKIMQEKYPCDTHLFYDPFRGGPVDLNYEGAPAGLMEGVD